MKSGYVHSFPPLIQSRILLLFILWIDFRKTMRKMSIVYETEDGFFSIKVADSWHPREPHTSHFCNRQGFLGNTQKISLENR